MRIVFAGTPETAVPTLDRLLHDHDVVAVITRPDAPRGRKRILTPSPVALRAQHLGLNLVKSSTFTPEIVEEIRRLQPDVGVVVAFGALIPPAVLTLPKQEWINLHFSALPTWRGASPLQRDIISGAETAHLTVFRLVTELDAGDILTTRKSPLDKFETSGRALERLATEGADVVAEVLEEMASGDISAAPQIGLVTYAPKLTAADAQLHANLSLITAFNLFRGVTPEPGAWIECSTGRLKIVDCVPEEPSEQPAGVKSGGLTTRDDSVLLGFADGYLKLIDVQPAGKSIMPAIDWLRGLQNPQTWSFS